MTDPSPADRRLRQMIEALCPGRSEEELREAERRFMAYVRLVTRICTRLEAEDRADRIAAGAPPDQDSTAADRPLQ